MSDVERKSWVLDNIPDVNRHDWAPMAMKAFKERFRQVALGRKECNFNEHLEKNSQNWKSLLADSIEHSGLDGMRLVGLNNGFLDSAIKLSDVPLMECIKNNENFMDGSDGKSVFFEIKNKKTVSNALSTLIKISIFLYEVRDCYLTSKVSNTGITKEHSPRDASAIKRKSRIFEEADSSLWKGLYFFCLAKKHLSPEKQLNEIIDEFVVEKELCDWIKDVYVKNACFIKKSLQKAQEQVAVEGGISFYDLDQIGSADCIKMLTRLDGSGGLRSAYDWVWSIEPMEIGSEVEKMALVLGLSDGYAEQVTDNNVVKRKSIAL